VTTRQLVQIIDLAAQMGESAEGAIAWLDRVQARVERDWAGPSHERQGEGDPADG